MEGICINCGKKGIIYTISRNDVRQEPLNCIDMCPKCSAENYISIIPALKLDRVC